MKTIIKRFSLIQSLLFLLIIKHLSAQNYEAIKADGEYFFFDSVYNRQLAIRIDSVASQNGSTTYFNFKQIRQSGSFFCNSPNGISWLGDPVISRADGSFRFSNVNPENGQITDSIMIRTREPLNSPWTMYRYPGSGDKLEAVISSVIRLTFLGITDSVKVISLTRKNILGQIINDEVNSEQILLSKNHGLLRLPRFDEFPAYTTMYSLCGMSNPSAGQVNPTIRTIFNFSAGDEIHTHYNEQYYFNMDGNIEYRIKKILQRVDAPDNSWVAYSTENCFVRIEQTGFQQYSYSNGQYISEDTIFFNSTLGYELSKEPLEPIINQWLYTTNGFLQFGRSAKVITYDLPYSVSPDSACWAPVAVDGVCDPYYIEGLGGPYYNCPANIFANTLINEVIYYKKGNESWGTPLNCDSLLNVGLTEIPVEQGFSILPNPAHAFIHIDSPAKAEGKLELYEISGKLAFAWPKVSRAVNLDISGLEAGVYIYRFIAGNGKQFHGKIILQ